MTEDHAEYTERTVYITPEQLRRREYHQQHYLLLVGVQASLQHVIGDLELLLDIEDGSFPILENILAQVQKAERCYHSAMSHRIFTWYNGD